MSVVVDMPMPKNCDTCFFRGVFYSEEDGHGDYYCGALWQLLKRKKYNVDHPRKGRLTNCPIICQLPEGHGRLVDADKLKEQSVHFCETEYTFDFDAVFVEEIDEATTIVPAEGANKWRIKKN